MQGLPFEGLSDKVAPRLVLSASWPSRIYYWSYIGIMENGNYDIIVGYIVA